MYPNVNVLRFLFSCGSGAVLGAVGADLLQNSPLFCNELY